MFMDWRKIYLTIFKGEAMMLTLLLHMTIWKMVEETPVGCAYFGME